MTVDKPTDLETLKAWQGKVLIDPSHPIGYITAHPTWNRWAAFTDDELDILRRACECYEWEYGQARREEGNYGNDLALEEINAELQRRKDTP